MRGRFKRQPHIKLCAIGTRAEVDFSVKRNALGFGLAALDLHAHLRIVSVPTFPQPPDFTLAAIGHRNEPDRVISRYVHARVCIITSHSVKVET